MKRYKEVFGLLGFLFLLNILAYAVVFDLNRPPLLEVTFFDVGQGDAFFMETPGGHQILIDGGPSSIILEKLGKEMSFWDRTIDLVILTHPEKDHLRGLLEVLKRYKIENILWTGVIRDTGEYKEWERLLQEEGAEVFIAKRGQKIKSGSFFLEILFPLENLAGKEFEKSNETSIVAKGVFRENSFLFTGDIGKVTEEKLLSEENFCRHFSLSEKKECPFSSLDSDVLKIGHHGSKHSTLEEFVKVVSPQMAIISVGKGNPYHHPHQEVLEILDKYGIRILRTDIDGDIKIISDGKNIKIKN